MARNVIRNSTNELFFNFSCDPLAVTLKSQFINHLGENPGISHILIATPVRTDCHIQYVLDCRLKALRIEIV